MTTILLLTCEGEAHDEDIETTLVAEALNARGVQSTIVAWSVPSLLDLDADLVLIRSTWDYTTRLDEFLRVLEQVTVPVANPLSVITWNLHKGYLTELAAAGVPVVPTVVISAGSYSTGAPATGVAPTLPDFASTEIIVKPAISAGAAGVGRFSAGSELATAHLASIVSSADALIQPFVSDVVDGERSIIHIGGKYSHSVRKIPAANDFRVQEIFGGTNIVHEPSAAELAVAESALAAVPSGPEKLVYSRVDLVGPADRPLVMEVELIEPELFLPLAPGSADALADAAIASARTRIGTVS